MINWWAAIVAGIVLYAIGAVWYTALFGKQYRALMGVPEGSAPQGMGQALAVGFVGNMVEAIGCAVLLSWIPGAGDVGGGIKAALVVWLAFVAAIMIPSILYERKPPMLVAINAGYQLVGLLAMGLVLGLWH